MKKKYYYDCPIQALYMNIEFGVKCDTEIKLSVDLSNDNYLKNMTPAITKIYVAQESEHIFEPKEGDIGQMKAEGARFFVKYSERSKEWKEWHGGGYYSDKNGSDIIYRNGKHFFNPKEEN